MRAAVIALVAASACAPGPSARALFPAVEDAAPRYGAGPFPSDAHRGPDGRLDVRAGLEDAAPWETDVLAAHVATLDGFGLRPAIEFFVDGDVDAPVPASTSSAADPVYVVDVDDGRVIPYLWRWDPARRRIAGAPALSASLDERRRYAAVLTTALAGKSDAFAALLADDDPPARWRGFVDIARAAIALRPFDPFTDVAAVAAFTTQDATGALRAAREVVHAAPAPTLSFDDPAVLFVGTERLDALLGRANRDDDGNERWGWSNGAGMAHDHVGAIGTGWYTSPRFTSDPTGSGLPDDDAFVYDDDGRPTILEPARRVPVTFVIPAGPPPPGGFPVAIFQHGLGASRHQVLAFAEPLASRGVALVAIDADGHGSRYQDVDDGNDCEVLGDGFTGDRALRDGFGDVEGMGTTFALFHDFKNLTAVKDSVRQTVLDLAQLVRLLRAGPDVSALGGARLDPTRVAYLGESYGGVVGATFAGIEPDVGLVILDVPGGGIFDMAVMGSPTLRPMFDLWIASLYGVEERLDRFHPLVSLGQAVLDGADPLSYAPRVLDGTKHVVLLEVLGDEVLPNRATDALAARMGLPVLAPHLDPRGLPTTPSPARGNIDGLTAALVQWGPATHGANWTNESGVRRFAPFGPSDEEEYVSLQEPVRIPNPLVPTLLQVLDVLDGFIAGETPTLRSYVAPTADFDADGVVDDEDPTPLSEAN